MTTLTIVFLCLFAVTAFLFIEMYNKQKRVAAITLGCINITLIFVICILLSSTPTYVTNLYQTKEKYLEIQEDEIVSDFSIFVDSVPASGFPEWDDEHPFSYLIDYRAKEVRIISDNDPSDVHLPEQPY